jgi:hypothetical protein
MGSHDCGKNVTASKRGLTPNRNLPGSPYVHLGYSEPAKLLRCKTSPAPDG